VCLFSPNLWKFPNRRVNKKSWKASNSDTYELGWWLIYQLPRWTPSSFSSTLSVSFSEIMFIHVLLAWCWIYPSWPCHLTWHHAILSAHIGQQSNKYLISVHSKEIPGYCRWFVLLCNVNVSLLPLIFQGQRQGYLSSYYWYFCYYVSNFPVSLFWMIVRRID